MIKEDFNKRENISKDLLLYKKIKDPRFGDIFLYQNKQNSKIIFKYKFITDKKSKAEEIIKIAKERIGLKGEFLLNFYDYSSEVLEDFCSNYYKIYYFLEYPENDLFNILVNKKLKNDKFSHEELTILAYQILNSLTVYEKNYIDHKNLKPVLISVDTEKNNLKELKFKLIDNFNLDAIQDIKGKIISGKDVYVSPELLKNLFKDKIEINFLKNDVFCWGLIILQCGLWESIKSIYDFQNKIIIEEKLRTFIKMFYSKYYNDNKFLCLLLSNLLCFDCNKRGTPFKIYSKIPNYEVIRDRLLKKKYCKTITNKTKTTNTNKESILNFKFGIDDKKSFLEKINELKNYDDDLKFDSLKNNQERFFFHKYDDPKKSKNLNLRPKTSHWFFNKK